jgi:hypothetical protein
MSLNPPILLTSCVHVSDESVSMKSSEDRVNFTLKSIEKWLSIVPNAEIVICDNSGFDFSNLIKENFPNKKIECLCFLGDKNAVKHYGKGYGEGEIIEYATKKSRFIINAGCFTKCTAKLWVKNYQYFLIQWNQKYIFKPIFKNIFSIKPLKLDHIDTRFYIVSTEFYQKYLADAHRKINPSTPYGIEEIFLEIFIANNLKNIFSQRYPEIHGVSGASGHTYRNSLKKNIKENFKYFLLRLNPRFRDLFKLN